VDTALFLLGEPPRSTTAAFGPPFEETGLPLDLGVVIRTKNNGLATISLSYNSTISRSDYLVIAEDDTYLVDDGRLLSKTGSVLVGGEMDETLRAAVASQDQDFVSAVSFGSASRSVIDSVLPTMRVLQEIEDQRNAT
jgi:predicted dehydrogenase